MRDLCCPPGVWVSPPAVVLKNQILLDYRTGNFSCYRTIKMFTTGRFTLENYRTIDNLAKEFNYQTNDYRNQEKTIDAQLCVK